MWIYQGSEFLKAPEGYDGFVYLITNLSSGRKYVGKKTFWSYKTKMVKNKAGVPKKKKIKGDSDWQRYWGSNDDLKADVASLGAHMFKREILHLCEGKGV